MNGPLANLDAMARFSAPICWSVASPTHKNKSQKPLDNTQQFGIVSGMTTNSAPVCAVCGREPHNPHRRIVDGKITEGCISAFHTGHLVENTASSHWHNRESAKSFRRNSRFDFNAKTGYWGK